MNLKRCTEGDPTQIRTELRRCRERAVRTNAYAIFVTYKRNLLINSSHLVVEYQDMNQVAIWTETSM